jgi:hypothetical protein
LLYFEGIFGSSESTFGSASGLRGLQTVDPGS